MVFQVGGIFHLKLHKNSKYTHTHTHIRERGNFLKAIYTMNFKKMFISVDCMIGYVSDCKLVKLNLD